MGSRLGVIVAAAWDVASGVRADVGTYQAEAEAMVPSDEHGWTLETGYGQNAAAAAAYALRAWLTDDPQEAAWAARLPIHREKHVADRSDLREQRLDFFLRSAEVEVPYENLGSHVVMLSFCDRCGSTSMGLRCSRVKFIREKV